ncbi:MAG: M14 family zinc carboxypeptidase [Chitinophagales bacterium]|nr:M14 family zinc carboxypeptidase [Chitinophagales bacterium]
MRYITLFLFLISAQLFAQQEGMYSRARVWTPGTTIQQLSSLGIAIDHGTYRKGAYLECDFSSFEIEKMRLAGFKVDVLIEDVSTYYAKRNQESAKQHKAMPTGTCFPTNYQVAIPFGFSYGSMGGYYTYQEMLDILDSMASQYPQLISPRQPIDTFLSHQGRPIFSLTITSNANPGVAKPQVLYTALHHAREPASLSQLIFYMYHLLENYGTDPEITYLLDNVEMVFVPCLNPDGYVRNETTNPTGGGLWRKNYRNNADGTFGVDLNRNYGYNWAYDDDGSSPISNDDTYRGPGPFSEPESQAMRYLCEQHDFKVALNHHTYGNLLVYPWGYEASLLTPDSTLFIELSKWMTQYNGYKYGTGDQTVNYTTNGDSDDWMYGEQISKGKIFALTPESGSQIDGFWPDQSQIVPICIDNVHQNLSAARFLLNYGRTEDLSASILPSTNGTLDVKVIKAGLDVAGALSVRLEPISPSILAVGNTVNVSGLGTFESDTVSFSYSIDPFALKGDSILFKLVLSNGIVETVDTLVKYLGPADTVISEVANSAVQWNGAWATTTSTFTSSPSAFTDSPNGNYLPNTNSTFLLDTVIDLSQAVFAQLSFNAKWALEPGYDFVMVQAKAGNGSWQPLCGKYTKEWALSQNEPLYDGFSNGWLREEMSLNDFLGSTIQLRFLLYSDDFVEEDGFYFDDLQVLALLTPDTTDSVSTQIQLLDENPIAVYPNPAQSHIDIVSAETLPAKISLWDAAGRLMKVIEAAGAHAVMDVSDLSNGIYLLRYQTEKTVYSKRIVLNH